MPHGGVPAADVDDDRAALVDVREQDRADHGHRGERGDADRAPAACGGRAEDERDRRADQRDQDHERDECVHSSLPPFLVGLRSSASCSLLVVEDPSGWPRRPASTCVEDRIRRRLRVVGVLVADGVALVAELRQPPGPVDEREDEGGDAEVDDDGREHEHLRHRVDHGLVGVVPVTIGAAPARAAHDAG